MITISFFLIIISSCALVSKDPVLPQKVQYEDGLPIIYIHPLPPSKEEYTGVTIYFKGKKYNAEGKVRGAASVSYPKRNYSLKFKKDDLFTFNDDIKDKEKIVLVSNFDDVSYMRTRLSYDLWNKTNNTFNVKSSSCIVYMNGEYYGLYTVVERIDGDLIDRHSLEGSINSGGNLYKGTSRNSNFYFNPTSVELPLQNTSVARGFEKKYGFPEAGNEGAYDDLEGLIEKLNDFSYDNFDLFFNRTFDAEDYLGWFSFTSFIHASDSVRNNCYHYHDLVTDKWHYIPWDFNVSFGQFTTLSRTGHESPVAFYEYNQIFNRINSDETLLSNYSEYNREKLNSSYNKQTLMELIDDIYDDIHIAAEKDSKHWKDERKDYYGTSGRNFSFEDEVTYIKNWISRQHDLWQEYY